MRIIDLKQKEVINTCNCKPLAVLWMWNLIPARTDFCHHHPGPGNSAVFSEETAEFCIPWECICQIGEDIILVEIDEKNA